MSLLVTDLAFRRSPPHLAATGLLGFAMFVVNEIMTVRDVSVRRTRAGRYVISFAVRPPRALPLRAVNRQGGPDRGTGADPRSGADRRRDPRSRYALAHPYSAECHVEIERQVIAQLRERGELP